MIKKRPRGKAIMTESEPKKKSKKELEQERLSFAEAIRLQEQMDEEQRAQIARDEEIARQWDEEERQRAIENGITIHMLTEKKYPLSQEMLSKMLSKRLEVDHESSQAYELLKFIISQVQK
ncbi:hypothetical protein Tco_0006863 [Tanacetum coccineum]